MAQASGLPMLTEQERACPTEATILDGGDDSRCAEPGIPGYLHAIGGSATNDGGIGCMRALGVRFLDDEGRELSGCGKDLIQIRTIDVSRLDKRVKETRFTVMCDVTNPLCGPDGATYTFGKQKGGTREVLEELEAGMEKLPGADPTAVRCGSEYGIRIFTRICLRY